MQIVLILLGLILALIVIGWILKTLIGIAMFAIVAVLAGFIAQSIMKYQGGLAFAFISGLLGGLIGVVVAKVLGAPTFISIGGLPVIWTILGACVVAGVAKLVEPRARRA